MASTVEARSLSALTDLAANPPLDPGRPLRGNFGPLTLYIARVPGSRDIFLTTLKTKDKVVSAHDVESCLYYLHVDVPEDELLKDTLRTEGAHAPDTVPEEGTAVISRKPLPSKPALALGDRPQPPSKKFPDFQPSLEGSRQIRINGRKPVETMVQQSNDRYEANPPLPRRPLVETPPALPTRRSEENTMPLLPPRRLQGPRALHSRNESVDIATLGRDLRKENVNPRRWSEQPDSPLEGNVSPLPAQSYGNQYAATTMSVRPESLCLSVTLIRRDPSSGEQWNVGRITSGSASGNGSPASHNLKDSQDEILLELNTPGYQKFSETKPSNDSKDGIRTRMSSQGHQLLGASLDTARLNVFRRVLQVGKSKAIPSTPSPRRSEFGPSLNTRSENRPSLDSSRSHSQTSHSPNWDESSASKYFSFSSPWQGRCTFTTSATGKTIKCRHMLPPGLRDRPANASLEPIGLQVSELRFNLPSSNVFKFRSQDHKRPTLSKFSRSSGSNPHPRQPRPQSGMSASQSTIDDDMSSEEDKMDLSLGQERAGGGFGGKKAKLGKLIVEYEGLKMLDLLVAVNMAIWWKVYE